MFMCVSTAQARAKSAPWVLLAIGLRPFPCDFRHKMALVTCPCAFWLCRLAQNVGRVVCGILPVNSGRKLLMWHVHVHVDCGAVLVCGVLPVNSCRKLLLWRPCAFRLRCKSLPKTALATCPCVFRLLRLAQSMCRGLGVRHFTCKYLHKMALMCISTAQACTKRGACLRRGIIIFNIILVHLIFRNITIVHLIFRNIPSSSSTSSSSSFSTSSSSHPPPYHPPLHLPHYHPHPHPPQHHPHPPPHNPRHHHPTPHHPRLHHPQHHRPQHYHPPPPHYHHSQHYHALSSRTLFGVPCRYNFVIFYCYKMILQLFKLGWYAQEAARQYWVNAEHHEGYGAAQDGWLSGGTPNTAKGYYMAQCNGCTAAWLQLGLFGFPVVLYFLWKTQIWHKHWKKSYQRVLHRFGLANLFAHWHCYTTDRDATQQACAAIRKFAEC